MSFEAGSRLLSRGRISKAFAGVAFLTLFAVPAAAQFAPVQSNVETRMQRIERDVRDLQFEVFRGQRPPVSGGTSAPSLPPEQLGSASQRLSDMEDTLRRTTGELEQLRHEVSKLRQIVERMQRAQQYDLGGGATPDSGLASASGNLGTLSSNTPRPLPGMTAPVEAESDPQVQFDAAMNLLAKAQYDASRQAFHNFADEHPKTDLAAQALYWSGDIAYSMQKNYDEAARDFAALLKTYPKAPNAPNGMLKLGLSLLALGQNQEGCAALAALPAKYPEAPPETLDRSHEEAVKAACA